MKLVKLHMAKKSKRKSAKFNPLEENKKKKMPKLKCSHKRGLKDLISKKSK